MKVYISHRTTKTMLHFNCSKISQSFVYIDKIFRNNAYINIIKTVRVPITSFTSHKAHGASPISISSALRLSQKPCLHCETTDTGLVYGAVCLFTPQLSLVFIAPTHGGMARLS